MHPLLMEARKGLLIPGTRVTFLWESPFGAWSWGKQPLFLTVSHLSGPRMSALLLKQVTKRFLQRILISLTTYTSYLLCAEGP